MRKHRTASFSCLGRGGQKPESSLAASAKLLRMRSRCDTSMWGEYSSPVAVAPAELGARTRRALSAARRCASPLRPSACGSSQTQSGNCAKSSALARSGATTCLMIDRRSLSRVSAADSVPLAHPSNDCIEAVPIGPCEGLPGCGQPMKNFRQGTGDNNKGDE